MAKVLLAYADAGHYSAQFSTHGNLVFNQLKALGYQVDLQVLDADAAIYTTLQSDATIYDFVVVVEGSGIGTASALVLDVLGGSLVVPVFHVYNIQSGNFSFFGHGLEQGTITSGAYRACTWEGNDLPLFCETRQISSTSSGNGPFSAGDYETLISDNVTGEIVAARYTGGSGSSVYMDAAASPAGNTLFILMQYAINNGEMPAPPRKGLIMMDVDDMPDINSTQTDVDNMISDYATFRIDITWGVDAANMNNNPDSMWASIEAAGIHCIENSESWDDTKSNIDTFYRANIVNMQAKGLTTGFDLAGIDSFGYHNFESNQIGDNGLQLGSPYNAEFCSVSGTTRQNGYGFKTIRLTVGDHAMAVDTPQLASPKDQREITINRGTAFLQGGSSITSGDLDLPYLANLDQYALQSIKLGIVEAAAYNKISYLHGTNFYDGHDGGTAPGLKVYEIMGNVVSFCASILEFAHPSDLAVRHGIATGSGFNES